MSKNENPEIRQGVDFGNVIKGLDMLANLVAQGVRVSGDFVEKFINQAKAPISSETAKKIVEQANQQPKR